MSVFDEIERAGCGLRPYSQPDFEYLNTSARPGVQAIRSCIESWFLRYPPAERVELRARLRSLDNYQHRSAYFELFLHELMLRLGLKVEVHPRLAETPRRPDFRATSQDGSASYVEAIVASDETREESAQKARMAEVYDSLNRLDSPDFYLGMDLSGAPATPPSARKMRAFLSRRLGALSFDEVSENFRVRGIPGVPHWEYQHDGWTIDFYPVPKGDRARGCPGLRPIGIQMEQFGLVETRESIRDAVLEKAGRYGELPEAYIIATNVLADHVDRTDVMDALFGFEGEQYRVAGGVVQERESVRAANGAWWGPEGVQNTRVSAVIFFPNLSQSNAPWIVPCVYHNPWAARPYRGQLNRLPRAVPADDDRRTQFLDGDSLAAILELPDGWPGQ